MINQVFQCYSMQQGMGIDAPPYMCINARTGVNCFWIVDNSQQVLSSLHKILQLSILHCTLVFHTLKYMDSCRMNCAS